MARNTVDWRVWFGTCKSMDELKASYKKLVMQHHPDRGGDTRTMQDINAAYTAAFEVFKNRQNAAADADPEGRVKHTSEMPEDFVKVIEALLRMQGITVELCGSWLWVSGDTKQHKEALKAAGCRWSPNKKMWYWHPAEERGHRHRAWDMDEIRGRYGSASIKNDRESVVRA